MAESEAEKSAFLAKLKAFEGMEAGEPEVGADPVNQPMIRHWVEAIGDRNPVYTDPEVAAASVHGQVIAPPVMPAGVGDARHRAPAGGRWQARRDDVMRLLDGAGFTSVVATNCEQEYDRMLHLGDHLQTRTVIDSISEEKQTGLGIGHFVTHARRVLDARRRERRPHAVPHPEVPSGDGPARARGCR